MKRFSIIALIGLIALLSTAFTVGDWGDPYYEEYMGLHQYHPSWDDFAVGTPTDPYFAEWPNW